MKTLLGSLLLIFVTTTASAKSSGLASQMVEKGLCNYWGTSNNVASESVTGELAEAGLAVVEVTGEALVCGAEGVSFLAYQYGLKPVGKGGKYVLCTLGAAITRTFEFLLGQPKQELDCKATPWSDKDPSEDR